MQPDVSGGTKADRRKHMEPSREAYRHFDSLFRFLDAYSLVIVAGIGFGICRVALNWATGIVQTGPSLPSNVGGHLVIDVGKVLGIVLFVSLTYFRDSERHSLALLILPSICLGVGVTLCYLCTVLLLPSTPLAVGCLLLGSGSAALFLQWLELFGDLSPRSALLGISWGYAANYLIGAPFLDQATAPVFLTILLASVLSFVLVAYCTNRLGEGISSRKVVPSGRITPPVPIVLLLVVFSFAYGMAENATGLGHSTIVAKIGGAVPALVVIVSILFLKHRFELRALYAFILPLMAAGIGCTLILGSQPWVSQTMLSASIAACYILGYTLACMASYQDRISALLPCAAVRLTVLLSSLAGLLFSVRMPGGFVPLTVEGILALMVIAYCAVLLKHDSYSLLIAPSFEQGAEPEGLLARFADEKGLTKREKTVFMLLASGKTAQEIADALFISPGAVRAHVSRIYSKAGVHSHSELEEEIERVAGIARARSGNM